MDRKNGPAQFELDEYSVSYHGYAHTHMDALCHLFIDGKAYNGMPQSSITAAGASKLAVVNFKNGIFSRAILMDIPRLKGVAYLEPNVAYLSRRPGRVGEEGGGESREWRYRIHPNGTVGSQSGEGSMGRGRPIGGANASCAKWLKARDVAMVGSDAATDVAPSGVPGVAQPLHQLLLVAMGTPIFDNCDLEAVSEAANSRKRWAFADGGSACSGGRIGIAAKSGRDVLNDGNRWNTAVRTVRQRSGPVLWSFAARASRNRGPVDRRRRAKYT